VFHSYEKYEKIAIVFHSYERASFSGFEAVGVEGIRALLRAEHHGVALHRFDDSIDGGLLTRVTAGLHNTPS